MKKIYFNNTIEKYTISLMSLFKHVKIENAYNDGSYYNIPLVYGDFNKYSIARKYIEEKGSTILSNYEMVPISAFRLTGMQFDPTRDNTNTITYDLRFSESLQKNFKFRTPIPVDYNFNYTVWVRTYNHMGQILEQIYPHFVRPFSLELQEFNDIQDIDREVLVELSSDTISISHNETQDNTQADNYKDIEISFDFTLKGFMHFPLKSNVGQIEKISVELADEEKSAASVNSESISKYMDILEAKKIERYKELGAKIDNNGKVETMNYINIEDFGE